MGTYFMFNGMLPEQYLKSMCYSSWVDINAYNDSSISCGLFKKMRSIRNSIKNSIPCTLLKHSLGLSNYHVSCITSKKLALQKECAEELQKFEEEILYPYSEKEDLVIRHGQGSKYRYESFFTMLGKPYFYIVRHKKNKEVTKIVKGKKESFLRKKGEIAAVACCVLRKVQSMNGNFIRAWYICDLKVGKKYLGEHLPVLIMKQGMWRLLQCPRGFGICKDQPNGQMAKSASIMMQHGPFSGLLKVSFNIYKFSATQIKQIENNLCLQELQKVKQVFEKHKYIKEGRFIFSSNEGLKEYSIRDKETGLMQRQKILHAVLANMTKNRVKKERQGYEHMFFALKGTSLDVALEEVGKSDLTQSGLLVSFRMDPNFRITSAEI